jgi:hypothetical protein
MSPKRGTLKMVPPFPARKCEVCGGTVLLGMEKFHLCPGPRPYPGAITIADGTRGMERGR